MSDLAITAANVVADDGAVSVRQHPAGEAIAAGQAVYLDSAAANVLKLAQADGTAAQATVYGIALCSAFAGQPCLVAVAGDLALGATLTVGTVYIVSATAGGICPVADLASSSYVSIIGVATAADNLKMNIFNSGAEKP